MAKAAGQEGGSGRPARGGSRRRRFLPRLRARLRTIWRRLLTLLGPLVLTGVLIWFSGVLFGTGVAYELLTISGMSFFGLGNTVIFGAAVLGENIRLETWDIAVWMIYLNAMAAFFYAYNLDLLEKLPLVGPYLRRARKNAVASLERHKWVRRLAAFGVGFFVITPLPGSGQLGGCFIGRIIGLAQRTILLIVTLAGTIVAVAYASLGTNIKSLLDDHEVQTWIRVIGAAFLIAVGWLVFKMLRYLGRPEAPAEPETA